VLITIDKIPAKRVRRGFRMFLVRWKRYNVDFDSSIPAVSVKNILTGNKTWTTIADSYFTLVSSASRKRYPKNTHASFTIQLAQPLDLGSTDKWEEEICEFNCPHSGTPNPVDVIGDTNVLIYCDTTPQFVGSN